ncbi:MAG: branched-chain amino acid ABC transporter permease [Candidatus Symbiobacter sp.]|nr:branched-chain amino acid ABC transporter permease [Candidatus Symbiobacter sp.]
MLRRIFSPPLPPLPPLSPMPPLPPLPPLPRLPRRRAEWMNLAVPLLLIVALLVLAAFGQILGGPFERTVIEAMIRVILVMGLAIFIGNSGIVSFGHTGFMLVAAYAAAWLTMPPMMKSLALPGLPPFLAEAEYGFLTSLVASSLLAGVVGLVVGLILMRLSGIAASIASFAFLAMMYAIYANWDRVTGATSSIVGIPTYSTVWNSSLLAGLAILVAYFYGRSRFGLALRATRDEPHAAAASGISLYWQRVLAFILSSFICGIAGVSYAHFLGVLNPGAFYLDLTFIALSMLVIGGRSSLCGGVVGVIALSGFIQILRWGEQGVSWGQTTLHLPNGVQEIVIGIIMVLSLIFRPQGLIAHDPVWGQKKLPPKAKHGR